MSAPTTPRPAPSPFPPYTPEPSGPACTDGAPLAQTLAAAAPGLRDLKWQTQVAALVLVALSNSVSAIVARVTAPSVEITRLTERVDALASVVSQQGSDLGAVRKDVRKLVCVVLPESFDCAPGPAASASRRRGAATAAADDTIVAQAGR